MIKNKKGFTLIELLAVIIILGVLMIIAIPSVTTYISNSRKSSYIDTAKNLIGAARNFVNNGKPEIYDKNATYYIPISCLSTENGSQTPYGEFDEAYVGVVYTGEGYNYYWISVDTSKQGIKNITPERELDIDLLESDLDVLEIKKTVDETGIGNRDKIRILNSDCKSWEEDKNVFSRITEDGEPVIIIYPEGKTKETVDIGDVVTIGTEEFNVLKREGDNLYLLARYNLNVGSNTIPNVPKGVQSGNGGRVKFSTSAYWANNNAYQGSYDHINNPYVYDSNSTIFQYVNDYKTYLEGLGINIKEARLLSYQEASAFNCPQYSMYNPICPCGLTFFDNTNFWLGSAFSNTEVYNRVIGGSTCYSGVTSYSSYSGVRPLIII